MYLIFQPAEEGEAGAKAMIDDGLFKRFPVDAVYGMHNWPGHQVGKMATRIGPIMAAMDVLAFYAKNTGRGAAPMGEMVGMGVAFTCVATLL